MAEPPLFSGNIDYIFTIIFPDGIQRPFFMNGKMALLAMLRKNANGTGRRWEVRIETSQGGGRSSTFANAQTNADGGDGVIFTVHGDKLDYATAQIPAPALIASQEDQGALIELVGNGAQQCEANLRDSMSLTAWTDGSGVIAKIVADVVPQVAGIGTFRYDDKRGARYFKLGQRLQTYDAITGGSADTGTAKVIAVNRPARTVKYQAIGGWDVTVDHFIVQEGDYNKKMMGVPGWIPYADPTPGENFFGVDRSVDRVLLAGVAIDSSGASSHREALLGSGEELMIYGIQPEYIFLSPGDFQQAQQEIEGASELRKVFVDVMTGRTVPEKSLSGMGTNAYVLGISGIQLANGSMIVPDAWAPDGYAYHLTMGSWELRSIGPAPHAAGTQKGEPTGVLVRRDATDTYEMRYRAVGNLVCHRPYENAVQKLPPRS